MGTTSDKHFDEGLSIYEQKVIGSPWSHCAGMISADSVPEDSKMTFSLNHKYAYVPKSNEERSKMWISDFKMRPEAMRTIVMLIRRNELSNYMYVAGIRKSIEKWYDQDLYSDYKYAKKRSEAMTSSKASRNDIVMHLLEIYDPDTINMLKKLVAEYDSEMLFANDIMTDSDFRIGNKFADLISDEILISDRDYSHDSSNGICDFVNSIKHIIKHKAGFAIHRGWARSY